MPYFEEVYYEHLENVRRQFRIEPLILGGVTASGGGSEGRPGGYIGKLPQTQITFDLSEASVWTIPPSGESLLDNLNRIRYRLTALEAGSGNITIQNNDSTIVPLADIIDFSTNFTVTQTPSGEANIELGPEIQVDSIGVGTGVPDVDTVGIAITNTFTNNLLPIHGIEVQITYQPTSVVLDDVFGTESTLTTAGSQGLNDVYGHKSVASLGGTTTADNLYGFYAQASALSNTSVTDLYGLLINVGGAGSITNEYGLYIEDVNNGGTLNYAIYTGAGEVRFGEDVTIANGDLIFGTDGTQITWSDTYIKHEYNANFDKKLAVITTTDASFPYGFGAEVTVPDLGVPSFGAHFLSTTENTNVTYGLGSRVTTANTSSITGAVYGSIFQIVTGGSANISNATNIYVLTQHNTNDTISNARGITIQGQVLQPSGTITTFEAIRIVTPTNNGTLGTAYGIRILDLDTATSNIAINTGKGVINFGDRLGITGSQDTVQLTVTANATQTNDIIQVKDSGGTQILGLDDGSNLTLYNGLGLEFDGYITLYPTTGSRLYVVPTEMDDTALYGINIEATTGHSTGNVFGLNVTLTRDDAGGAYYATRSRIVQTNTTGTQGWAAAQFVQGVKSGAGDITTFIGTYNAMEVASGAGAVSSATNLYLQFLHHSSSTVSTGRGLFIVSPTNDGGGTISTYYGIYIADITAASNNYSIYTGAGVVRFGGDTLIAGDDSGSTPNQLQVRGVTNGAKQLLIGFNTTSDYGSIQAIEQSVAYRDLILEVNGGNVGIGHASPDTILDIDGAFTFRALSADPSDPDNDSAALWMSDGTGSGDDGDIMIKITDSGGTTKTVTLVDYSAA